MVIIQINAKLLFVLVFVSCRATAGTVQAQVVWPITAGLQPQAALLVVVDTSAKCL